MRGVNYVVLVTKVRVLRQPTMVRRASGSSGASDTKLNAAKERRMTKSREKATNIHAPNGMNDEKSACWSKVAIVSRFISRRTAEGTLHSCLLVANIVWYRSVVRQSPRPNRVVEKWVRESCVRIHAAKAKHHHENRLVSTQRSPRMNVIQVPVLQNLSFSFSFVHQLFFYFFLSFLMNITLCHVFLFDSH